MRQDVDFIRVDQQAGLFKVNRRNFVDPEIFKAELDAVFGKCWLYVGHDSELPTPGAFVTRSVGGRDLIFNRDADGATHAFFNVCPHRGGPVCRESAGRARTFRCFYHGWTFASDGRLAKLPFEQAYPDDFATTQDLGLREAPHLDQYGGFWFVNFDPGAKQTLREYLAGVTEYIDRLNAFGPAGVSVIPGTHDYGMRANWKLLVENSADPFHAESTHASFGLTLRDQLAELDAPLPEQSGLFTESVVKDLGNGHSAFEVVPTFGRPVAQWHPSWGPKAKEAVDEVYDELVHRLGQDRADVIAKRCFNLIVFPNLLIVDQMATNFRTLTPVSPDELISRNWTFGIKGENQLLRDTRLQSTMEFMGPGGFGTPDDATALEACQRGYHNPGAGEWNDISGGMLPGRGAAESEVPIRTFWTQWAKYMEAAPA